MVTEYSWLGVPNLHRVTIFKPKIKTQFVKKNFIHLNYFTIFISESFFL